MSRQFSVPTVLRMVPNTLLSEFFGRLGYGELDVNFADLKERDVAPLLAYVSRLKPRERDEVEATLHGVFDLACEKGMDSLIEASLQCSEPGFLQSLPAEEGPYHKAMWTWLRYPVVFERAVLIHQVDNMSWWRKRNDLPCHAPDVSESALGQLAAELSNLFQWEQGRGQRCTVETFSRNDGTDYFFAYPDDFAVTVVAHDDEGHLAASTFRQTFVVAFAFNRGEGSLELFAKIPSRLKGRLEEIFSRTILHYELEPWRPDAAYELNGLKKRQLLPTDPKDAVRAHIRRMRLSSSDFRRRIVFEADYARDPQDVYTMLDDYLDKTNAPLSAFNVTLVTLTIEFLPKDGRKPGTLTFDVAFPNSCSLRNQRPERIELAKKYLKEWGIDGSRTISTRSGSPRLERSQFPGGMGAPGTPRGT